MSSLHHQHHLATVNNDFVNAAATVNNDVAGVVNAAATVNNDAATVNAAAAIVIYNAAATAVIIVAGMVGGADPPPCTKYIDNRAFLSVQQCHG